MAYRMTNQSAKHSYRTEITSWGSIVVVRNDDGATIEFAFGDTSKEARQRAIKEAKRAGLVEWG